MHTRRVLFTANLALVAALPLRILAAQTAAHDTATGRDSAIASDSAAAAAQSAGFSPVVHAMGFGDATYLATDRKVASGFMLGQVVGHVIAALTDRLTYFGEFTATAQPTGYAFEVERSILRYDFSDQFKLSGGRYHTPIGYWNTAFHHGTWLQTTVSRPEMVKYGSQFIPTHFVGVMAEGNVPSGGLGLGYMLGVGNGRGAIISRASDAGDANGSRALVASVSAQPEFPFGLKVGAGYYHDRVTPAQGLAANEGIASAYVAWQHERPEFIAEYAQVRHTSVAGGPTTSSYGYYAQFAYRLAGAAHQWKPYVRVEQLVPSPHDVIFAPLELGYRGGIGGIRYDFTPYAALKTEYRREHFQGHGWSNSVYVNASFVIPDLGGGGM